MNDKIKNIFDKDHIETDPTRLPEIIALSADTRIDLLQKLTDLHARYAESPDTHSFATLSAESRSAFSHKKACRFLFCADPSDNPAHVLTNAIQDFQNQSESYWNSKNAFFSENAFSGELAFAFPGQGSQYTFMGQDLLLSFPEVHQTLAAANQAFDRSLKLTDYIYPDLSGSNDGKSEAEEKLRSTDIAQPSIGAVSASMKKILKHFGIEPVATCGHSYGELSALFASGWFDEKTFFELSVARGKYMATAAGTGDKGGMLAVKAPLERIDDLIRTTGVDVVLANRNSPDQGVLSGPTDAIHKMKSICSENKMRSTILPVAAAFHSKLVRNAAEPFQRKIASVKFLHPRIPVYSNTTGLPYPSSEQEAQNLLGNHLMNPVNFIDEIRNMYDSGIRIFIEVGPRTVLTGLIKAILKDQGIFAMALDASSGRRCGITDVAKTICQLAALGYPVKLVKWKRS